MSNKLIDKLPSFYDSGNVVASIQESFENEKNMLEQELNSFINQFFVDKADWGLKLWEDFLGIPVDENLDIHLRKARIKAKITRTTPALTQNQLVNILKPYFKTVIINEFAKENRFEVIFGTSTIIGNNLNIAINEIEESKPAHLSYNVGINYILNILISRLFNKWQSETIPLCGTIDCSYNELITTSGAANYNNINTLITKAFSELLEFASEENFIEDINGKLLSEQITRLAINLYSDVIKTVSESVFVEEGGGNVD